MNKRYLAGPIAMLVVGAVLVAGCTSPTTTSPTPTTTTTAAAVSRDPFLNQFVISMEKQIGNNTTISAWVEKWENGTTVNIQARYDGTSLNRTVMRFASISDATTYANNLTAGYVVTTNVTKVPYVAYQLTKGSTPTVYKAWTKPQLRPPGIVTVQQIDDTVVIDTFSTGSSSAAT